MIHTLQANAHEGLNQWLDGWRGYCPPLLVEMVCLDWTIRGFANFSFDVGVFD